MKPRGYRLHEYPPGECSGHVVATSRWAWPLSVRWIIRERFAQPGTRFGISPAGPH